MTAARPPDPRTRRLASEQRELFVLARGSGGALEVLAAEGDPPSLYRLRLRVPGVEALRGGAIVVREVHDLTIHLWGDYPFTAPLVQVESPILNPHVWSHGAVCLGDRGVDEGLADLVARLARVIQYDPAHLDLTSVANRDALPAVQWLRDEGRLPLARVDLRVPASPPPRPAVVWAERRP